MKDEAEVEMMSEIDGMVSSDCKTESQVTIGGESTVTVHRVEHEEDCDEEDGDEEVGYDTDSDISIEVESTLTVV